MLEYISLDIETLGLPKDRVMPPIIEIGAIYDKLGVGEMPYSEEALVNTAFHVYVLPESMFGYQGVDPYAAAMNYKILEQIANATALSDGTLRAPDGTEVIHPDRVLIEFSRWLSYHGLVECREVNEEDEVVGYLTEDGPFRMIDHRTDLIYSYGDTKLTFAGKNVGTFDLAILDANVGFYQIPRRHRIIDPGSMLLALEDEKIPDLAECCRRTGVDDNVTHTAVEDALKVVRVIRAHLNNMHSVAAITQAMAEKMGVDRERQGKAIKYSSATA